ncbi:MAG: hypothetical protein K0R08_326 [Solimicrobium sp.]|jgi:hypothetical protein|nr:hypothetical protein [Solimicrobium sp.]
MSLDQILHVASGEANTCSVHERVVPCASTQVSALLERFHEMYSPCWPHVKWPRDAFDGTIKVGSIGGHGATRYRTERYVSGEGIVFRYIAPKGYQGVHGFSLYDNTSGFTLIKHFTYLQLSAYHWLMWRCCIRWVHEALIEDLLDGIELHLTGALERPRRWKWRVYLIRHALGGVRLLIDAVTLKRK